MNDIKDEKYFWYKVISKQLSDSAVSFKFNRAKKHYLNGCLHKFDITENKISASFINNSSFFSNNVEIQKFSANKIEKIVNYFKKDREALLDILTGYLPIYAYNELLSEFKVNLLITKEDVSLTCDCQAKNCEHVYTTLIKLINEIKYYPVYLLTLRGINVDKLYELIFGFHWNLEENQIELTQENIEKSHVPIIDKNYFGKEIPKIDICDWNYSENYIESGKINEEFYKKFTELKEFIKTKIKLF